MLVRDQRREHESPQCEQDARDDEPRSHHRGAERPPPARLARRRFVSNRLVGADHGLHAVSAYENLHAFAWFLW